MQSWFYFLAFNLKRSWRGRRERFKVSLDFSRIVWLPCRICRWWKMECIGHQINWRKYTRAPLSVHCSRYMWAKKHRQFSGNQITRIKLPIKEIYSNKKQWNSKHLPKTGWEKRTKSKLNIRFRIFSFSIFSNLLSKHMKYANMY